MSEIILGQGLDLVECRRIEESLSRFGERFGFAIEDVKDVVMNRSFDRKRRGVSPAKLHDAFGRNGCRCRTHGRSSPVTT